MSLPPLPGRPAADYAAASLQAKAGQLGKSDPEGEPFGDLLSAMLNMGEPARTQGRIEPEADSASAASVSAIPAPRELLPGLPVETSGRLSVNLLDFSVADPGEPRQVARSIEGDSAELQEIMDGSRLGGPVQAAPIAGTGIGPAPFEKVQPASARFSANGPTAATVDGVGDALAGSADAFPGNGDAMSETERRSTGPQRAEMFNEHGLFSGTTARGPSLGPDGKSTFPGSGARRPMASAGSKLGAARAASFPTPELGPSVERGGVEADPAGVAVRGQAAADRAGAGVALRGGAAVAVHASRASVAPPLAQLGRLDRALVQPFSDQGSEGPGGAAAQRRAVRLVQEFLESGSASTAQVTVQAAEQGISLFARVERLSREERSRLRAEIAGLLARHGFAASEIRLNGEAGPGRRP